MGVHMRHNTKHSSADKEFLPKTFDLSLGNIHFSIKKLESKKCTRKNVYHMILKGQSKFSRKSPFSVAIIFFTITFSLVFFKVIKEKLDP